MKKITKLLVAALCFALLFGVVLGITASANDNTDGDKWVVSANVAYAESIYPYFAIDASLAENTSLLSVKITRGDEVYECWLKDSSVDIYGDGSVIAHVVKGTGVSAKDMTDDLVIEVSYDGKIVETTTYSIVEYFYERLYKNDCIKAVISSDILRKNLYLSALEYCSAAQLVLSDENDDPKNIADLIYVWGDVEGQLLNKNSASITLDSNLYKLEYFNADGSTNTEKAFDIAGKAGEYSISTFTKVSKAPKLSTAPAGAITFDSLNGTSYTAGSSGTSLNLSGGAIGSVYQTNQSNSIISTAVEDDGFGNIALSLNKGDSAGASSAQTWTNYVVDTNQTKDLSTVVFEARIKLSVFANGDGLYFRIYTGDRSISGEGNRILHTKFVDTNDAIYFGEDANDIKNLSIKNGEWATIRYTVSDYSNAETPNFVLSVFDEATGTFVPKYSKAVSDISDVSAITCFTLMTTNGNVADQDLDYVYVGVAPTSYGAEGTAVPTFSAGSIEATISPKAN